ncbi:MAG TPA: DUF6263 family protein [Williamwhitmania sp.]|nr:DUF6263 family protein [Williamwhitmania sp.]
MKKLFAITLGLLFAVSLFAQPSAKINLALNLEVGKTYTLNQKSTQDISQLIMGTEQNIKTEISGVNTFLVKAMSDSGYTVELRFKKMLFKMTSAMINMEFNSEKPVGEDDMFGQVMLSFVKNPYTMVLSKTGEVLAVNGVDEAIDKTVNDLDVPDMSKMQIKASVKNSFGSETLKSSFEIIMRCYPEQPVAVGDTWENTVDLKMLGRTIKNNSWTLKAIDDGEATVLGNAKMEAATSDKPIVINGMNARANLTGTEQSTFKLDVNTGWITTATSTSTYEGTLVIEKNAQLPNDLEIPMKFTTINNFTATE